MITFFSFDDLVQSKLMTLVHCVSSLVTIFPSSSRLLLEILPSTTRLRKSSDLRSQFILKYSSLIFSTFLNTLRCPLPRRFKTILGSKIGTAFLKVLFIIHNVSIDKLQYYNQVSSIIQRKIISALHYNSKSI